MREGSHSWSVLTVRFCVATALLALVVSTAHAGESILTRQSADPWASFLPTSSRFSLLDPSKLEISHQLVFSYSSGSARNNDIGGLWLTSLRYDISSPLTMGLTLGSSMSRSSVSGFQADKLFLESLSVRYAPSDRFLFLLMYKQIPDGFLYFPTHRPY